MKELAIAIKEIRYPELYLGDSIKKHNSKTGRCILSGKYELLQNGDIRISIVATSENAVPALVHAEGYFETRDFNPEDESDVDFARRAGFAYLFPFVRAAMTNLYAVAGISIAPMPFLVIDDIFGGIPLLRSKE